MKNAKKRAFALALAILSTILCFTACDSGVKNTADETTLGAQTDKKTEAATTTSPETEGEPNVETETSPKIKITNGKFTVGGKELFINGVNTPWENWNDFGGNFNGSFWNSHFRDLHEIGVNASRVWINCNSMVGIKLDADGKVLEVTEKHWQDVDELFRIAEKNHIYLLPTLLSFDHFKSPDSAERWRRVVTDDAARKSYIDNYVVPFAERYGDRAYLFGIDLMNEPDWVHENAECGQLPLDALSKFFAECTSAIHKTSPDTLVTVGDGKHRKAHTRPRFPARGA